MITRVLGFFYMPNTPTSRPAVGKDFILDSKLNVHVHKSGFFDLTTPAGNKAFEDTAAKLLDKHTIFTWIPRPKIIVEQNEVPEARRISTMTELNIATGKISWTPSGEVVAPAPGGRPLPLPLELAPAPSPVASPQPQEESDSSVAHNHAPEGSNPSPATPSPTAPSSSLAPYTVVPIGDRFLIARHAEGMEDKFRGQEDFWSDTPEGAEADAFPDEDAATAVVAKLLKAKQPKAPTKKKK